MRRHRASRKSLTPPQHQKKPRASPWANLSAQIQIHRPILAKRDPSHGARERDVPDLDLDGCEAYRATVRQGDRRP